jgi:hypothetical protein
VSVDTRHHLQHTPWWVVWQRVWPRDQGRVQITKALCEGDKAVLRGLGVVQHLVRPSHTTQPLMDCRLWNAAQTVKSHITLRHCPEVI